MAQEKVATESAEEMALWLENLPSISMNFPGAEHSFVSGSAAHRPVQVKYHLYDFNSSVGSLTESKSTWRALLQEFMSTADHAFRGCALFATIEFTNLCQGPPGHAHGGSVAAVLDELMGGVCWLNGVAVVARHIEVDFLAPVPLQTVQCGTAVVTRKEGRKLQTSARIFRSDGKPLASSKGLFIELDERTIQGLRS